MADRAELEDKTVKELHELASDAGIEGHSSMNKPELVDALADDGGDGDAGSDASDDEGVSGGVLQGSADDAEDVDVPDEQADPASARSFDASKVRSTADAVNEGTHTRAGADGRIQQVAQVRTDLS